MAFKISVEVPLFLAFFGFLLIDTLNTNLLIFRTCYVTLGLDKANCSLLGKVSNATTKELEKIVQPKADIISMTKTSIDSVFGAFMCLFVGAWSDRFGRKPVIVMNLIGQTVMMWVMAVFAALEDASPWYMLTCSIPVILTGGGASFLTVLLAYLTDVTSSENRGLRMGIFEVFMAAGVLFGNFASPYLLNATNYVVVYLLAILSLFTALIYTIFWIPESLQTPDSEDRIKGFFQSQNVTGIFRTTFMHRPGHSRSIILLLVLALAIYFVTIAGSGSVMFLFMREKFHWTFQQYTWYSSTTNILWIIGGFFMVYIIHHRLKVPESPLILLGFLTMTIGALVQALANEDWLIYLAAVIRFPSACLTPMVRSLLSKLVAANEAAKIFAVFNIASNLLGLVGAPVYTTLYNATMENSAGIFNLVTAGADVVNTACVLAVVFLRRSEQFNPYSTLNNDESTTPPDQID